MTAEQKPDGAARTRIALGQLTEHVMKWQRAGIDDAALEKAKEALAAAVSAPQEPALCMCKDRPLSECPGEWEPGCDLGANEKYVRRAAPQEPQEHSSAPSDKQLTLLGAPWHLNLVTGQDRADLLAYGRAVWAAAQAPSVVPVAPIVRLPLMPMPAYGPNSQVAGDVRGAWGEGQMMDYAKAAVALNRYATPPQPPAQPAEERADAERYRWLRDKPCWTVDEGTVGSVRWSVEFSCHYGHTDDEDSLDSAIDAARAAQSSEGE